MHLCRKSGALFRGRDFQKDSCAIDYTVVKCRIQRAEKKFDNDAYSKRVSCDLVYARERDPFSLQQKTKLNRKLTIFFVRQTVL